MDLKSIYPGKNQNNNINHALATPKPQDLG